jgi:hypothetical protein
MAIVAAAGFQHSRGPAEPSNSKTAEGGRELPEKKKFSP